MSALTGSQRAEKRKSKIKSIISKSPPKLSTGAQKRTKDHFTSIKLNSGLRYFNEDIDIAKIWDTVRRKFSTHVGVSVRRPDDLLVFDLFFENMKLEPGDSPRLMKVDKNTCALLIVEYPPQSFGEEAFLERVPELDPKPKEKPKTKRTEPVPVLLPEDQGPPAAWPRVRMAGHSRVAFSMPKSLEKVGLPYTLIDVLNALKTWPMVLDMSAISEPISIDEWKLDNAVKLDRDWFRLVTTSASWKVMLTSFMSALEAYGAHGADRAVMTAARRIGERAAMGLAARRRQGLKQALRAALQNEVHDLQIRFQQLVQGEGRDVALAAISLAASQTLAASDTKFEFDTSIMNVIPFIPMFFKPHNPPRCVTALEVPYRLILSPVEPAHWIHADEAVKHNGRTELWHTRLTTGTRNFGPEGLTKVRAIWSPDYPITDFSPFLDPPLPFRMSLDQPDRKMLVDLMVGFNKKTSTGVAYYPQASNASRLHLSALGSLLEVEGNWEPRPDKVDLAQWRHVATSGRDHYVRVVYAGFLCPFGNAASLIKVTERKFESITGDVKKKRVAVLRQRFFIVVREQIKQYFGQNHQFSGRNFPFTQIEIITRVTPNLAAPGEGKSAIKKEGVYDGTNVFPRYCILAYGRGSDRGL